MPITIIGNCWLGMKDFEKAKLDFEKVIALDENHEKAYLFKRLLRASTKKYAETIQSLDMAIRLNQIQKKHISIETANLNTENMLKQRDGLTHAISLGSQSHVTFKIGHLLGRNKEKYRNHGDF